MRELNPWQQRSAGRNQWRAYYRAYITSPAWYRRREQWVADALDELTVLVTEAGTGGQAVIECVGCGAGWRPKSDDLHHASYDRLGEEAHEDLWPMCRGCHAWVHELMRSTSTWRKLPLPQASPLALAALHDAIDRG